jgi:hypothetical protein
MTPASEAPRASGVATGIAEADKPGANAKVQAASPLKKSRFINHPPWIALSRKERNVQRAFQFLFEDRRQVKEFES